MRKTHTFEALVVILFLAISAFANFPITGYQTAGETTTASTATAASGTVDTVIIVNGGDVSTIDAAIASAISYDTGVPVLYTDHDDVSPGVLSTLLNGEYKEATNVVIIGGPAVVSDDAQDSLEQVGESAGYDVVRLSGATATGTAVEAVEYFYGPELLDKVTLVQYSSDNDQSYQEALHLSAELGHPIIPVPTDVLGAPADVIEALDTLGVDEVNVVGDFTNENVIQTDLLEVGVGIGQEFDGDKEQVEEQLEQEIEDDIRLGDEIIFVEEGIAPPPLPDHKIFFYRDENNDNIDDDSGSVLDGIGLGLYDDLKEKFGSNPVESIKIISDDADVQEQFAEALSKEGVPVKTGEADAVKTAVEFTKTEIKEIKDRFEQKEEEFENLYEEHKAEFAAALPSMLEQFKSYYTLKKTELSPEALEIGAKVIDEANKDDVVAQWKLMQAFQNSYEHENYVKQCDSACQSEWIEFEHENTDQKLERLVGTDRAREVANLDEGKKIGLLGLDDYYVPGQAQEFHDKISALFAAGVSAEQLDTQFIDAQKSDAQKTFLESVKQEYVSSKTGQDPAKWDESKLHEQYEKRFSLESEAYLAGVYTEDHFDDPAKRAEIMNTFQTVDTTLANSGVKDANYLTPDQWKNAYDTYKSDGKFSQDDIKSYEAAVTAYKTYEYQHAGESYNPEGGSYNSKSGQFTYVDAAAGDALVAGTYNADTKSYVYTNEEGKLVQGSYSGEFHEYKPEELPSGYSYNEKSGTYSYGSTTYTPPAEYKAETGAYTYSYTDPSSGSTYTTNYNYYYTPPSSEGTSNLAGSATGTSGTGYSGGEATSGSTAPTYTTTTTSTTSSGTTTTSTYSGGSTDSGGTTSGTTSGGYTAPSGGDSGGGGYSAPSAPSGGDGGGGGGGGY